MNIFAESVQSVLSYTSAAILDIVRGVVVTPSKLHAPLIEGNESKYVSECVERGEVTHGPHVERFEAGICKRIGGLTNSAKVIAVCNGTAALHLALSAIGVGYGDKVVIPAFTFVATANAVRYCGAVPQFVDCDSQGGLDPNRLEDWLSSHPGVRAVVCVHSFGSPCQVKELSEVCDKHGVPLIEDAASALGAKYGSKYAGTYGVAGIFSFNGNKIITTGGGGAVVTTEIGLEKKIRSLANVAKKDVPYEFWHSETGFNYRMPNLNAAFGCGQLENFYQIWSRKVVLARRYQEAFSGCPAASILEQNPGSNHWLNTIKLSDVSKRKETAAALDVNGFECRLGWTPLHFLPMYRDAERDDLKMTEELARSIINLPSGPGIIL